MRKSTKLGKNICLIYQKKVMIKKTCFKVKIKMNFKRENPALVLTEIVLTREHDCFKTNPCPFESKFY